ncbi:MAG: hypothetical protein EXQ86_11175 [Rhodospirillales bacterium]|nr:hypothetical protein [Rhodospirillales bacterium]
MVFSKEDIENLAKEHEAVVGKYQQLLTGYLERTYKNQRAQEFAKQGFSRRLKTLVRCIERVFEILPPDRIDLPTGDERTDAEINVQAFIFNVFGCADNLAWIWVLEKGLTRENGSPIPNRSVGLGGKSEIVRRSFSPEFQKYLEGLNGWFCHLENFRHALAHRIPLYIPPYIISTDMLTTYQELGNRMVEALKRHEFQEYDRLSAEQEALAVFIPYITHSFEEKAAIVVVHAQMLADFNTIEALGRKMIEELDRKLV